ncbi:MAG: SGNH/GDSL hydrolase family protein [Verrucomicrobiota bacterium]
MIKRFLCSLVYLMVGCGLCQGGDSAKQAWTNLVGEKFAKRAPFAYVENKDTLPNVLIYGDSISIAYTDTVRKELEGKANVYRLWCNGGDSSSFVGKVDKMETVMREPGLKGGWDFDWDVIHFNVGLHDLKYVLKGQLNREEGAQVSSITAYKENLRGIIKYLRSHYGQAKLIFGTTTPVPEGAAGRDAGDSVKYNKAALEVISEFPEIMVNDLYALSKPHQKEWWTKPGNVHFAKAGYEAQGKAVAERVLQSLGN